MRVNIYLNDEEYAYTHTQGKGYIRTLVQQAMTGETVGKKSPKATPHQRVPRLEKILQDKKIKVVQGVKGDGFHTCKMCGSLLPYYKGKCKQCR